MLKMKRITDLLIPNEKFRVPKIGLKIKISTGKAYPTKTSAIFCLVTFRFFFSSFLLLIDSGNKCMM